MTKVLITGASGFVGSHLVEESIRLGLVTYAGIRASSSKEYLSHPDIKFINLDLSNTDELRGVFKEIAFDIVIHCAGLTKTLSDEAFYKVNVEFTENLAAASLDSPNLKKFVFLSSLAAYGPADLQADGVVSVSSEPRPVTKYGKSKLKAEMRLKTYESLPLLIFRPTGIFGPRESDFFTIFDTINKGISPSIGYEEQWIKLVYIRDLVRVIMKASLSNIAGQDYFISDGNLYKTTNFNDLIAKVLNKNPMRIKVPFFVVNALARVSELVAKLRNEPSILNSDKLPEIKARNLDCDISNLVNDFDFKPEYSLEEALRETAKWYREKEWL